jgi:hypothetical protein
MSQRAAKEEREQEKQNAALAGFVIGGFSTCAAMEAGTG